MLGHTPKSFSIKNQKTISFFLSTEDLIKSTTPLNETVIKKPQYKMETAPAEMTRVLVFGGKTGWIGGLMVDMVGKMGKYHCRTISGVFSSIIVEVARTIL